MLQTEQLESALAELIGKTIGGAPPLLGRETPIADLGLDSLARIDLAVAAEDRFSIAIPDEVLERFVTIGDLIDFLSVGAVLLPAGKARAAS
jgi:acyl carrier protein